MVRWSFDGGTNWDGPSPVFATTEGTVLGYVDTSDDGAKSWALEITDSEGFVTTASGSVTVNNVDPQLTLDSVPTVIYDGMEAYISASTSDYGWYDALTATITWSDGTVEVQQLPSNPASFGAYHAFDLTADQTVSVTITIDDPDGGSVSKSANFLYDDILNNVDGEAQGQIGGTITYLIGAHCDLGEIQSYEIDLNDDGFFEIWYSVTSDDPDPEKIAIPFSSGVELLGANPGVFGGQIRVTNNIGATQTGPLVTTIALQNGGAPATLGMPSVGNNSQIGNNITATEHSKIVDGEFAAIFSIPGGSGSSTVLAGPGGTTITVSAAELRGDKNAFQSAHIFYGASVNIGITIPQATNLSDYPYFAQYAKFRHLIQHPVVGGLSIVNVSPWQIDGPLLGLPGMPGFYRGQGLGVNSAYMDDFPGSFKSATYHFTWDPAPGGRGLVIKLATTLAAAKAALVANLPNGQEFEEFSFQTYIVAPGNPAAPIGYYEWQFTVMKQSTGYVCFWNQTPTFNPGLDAGVWNGGI